MLTLEQEQKPVDQYTQAEREKALTDYQKMLNDDPEKSILKLINTKSGEFRIKPDVLFNNLVDILFLKFTHKKIPENLKKYHYTEKWFSYYLYKIIETKPFNDCIGELLIESNFYNEKGLGQFMTPNDVSSLVSQLIDSWNDNKESISILEPCCGTGSMILNSLKGINKNKISILINDIDLQMVKICYIQLALNILMHLPPNIIVEVKAFNCNIITEYNYPSNKLVYQAEFNNCH